MQITKDVKSVKKFKETTRCLFLLFFLGPFYLFLVLSNASQGAEGGRSFDGELKHQVTYILCFILVEFSMHIPYHVHFWWKSEWSTLDMIDTKWHYNFRPRPLMRLSLDLSFVQVSTDLKLWNLFCWVYIRLRKILPLK